MIQQRPRVYSISEQIKITKMSLFVSGIFLLLVKRPVAFVDNVSHKEGGNRVPPRAF